MPFGAEEPDQKNIICAFHACFEGWKVNIKDGMAQEDEARQHATPWVSRYKQKANKWKLATTTEENQTVILVIYLKPSEPIHHQANPLF